MSLLLIRQNWHFARLIEFLFGMEPESLHDRQGKHSKLVGVFKWPFLLALIGLAVPTPWSFDFLVTFIGGFIVGWRDFWRPKPKELPSPDIVVVRETERV